MNSDTQLEGPAEVSRRLAERLRVERLRREWKQDTLARRSGVSLATIRRYERTGNTSVENLLKLCQALGLLDDFAVMLTPPPARTLAELESRETGGIPVRKRGVR